MLPGGLAAICDMESWTAIIRSLAVLCLKMDVDGSYKLRRGLVVVAG